MSDRPSEMNDAEIDAAMASLEGWNVRSDGKAINKAFMFDDFLTAFAFMGKVAVKAEELDHHPEWFNVYNRVEVTLNTHDAGGITTLDTTMAAFMNGAAG